MSHYKVASTAFKQYEGCQKASDASSVPTCTASICHKLDSTTQDTTLQRQTSVRLITVYYLQIVEKKVIERHGPTAR